MIVFIRLSSELVIFIFLNRKIICGLFMPLDLDFGPSRDFGPGVRLHHGVYHPRHARVDRVTTGWRHTGEVAHKTRVEAGWVVGLAGLSVGAAATHVSSHTRVARGVDPVVWGVGVGSVRWDTDLVLWTASTWICWLEKKSRTG